VGARRMQGVSVIIVIRGFYETQRKAAYYVRETDGMQGVE